jgi:hypothetical protein
MCQRGQHHQIVPSPPMYFLDSFDMWRGYLSSPPPLLAFPLGIWNAKKRRKTKVYAPPRLRYILRVPKPAPTVLHFPSLCSFSSACTLPRVFPRLQNFPPFIPLPSCACSPFLPPFPPALVPPFVQCRASIRFLRIYIQVQRNCVDNRGIVIERLSWGCNNRLEFVAYISTVERESGNSGCGKKNERLWLS